MSGTWAEANERQACLNCGASGAQAFRLADGRVVRACQECLRMEGVCEWMRGEEVSETAVGDRSYKLCRCHRCGVVERCTPSNDFYGVDGSRLICERCVLVKHRVAGPMIHLSREECDGG